MLIPFAPKMPSEPDEPSVPEVVPIEELSLERIDAAEAEDEWPWTA